MAMFKALMDDDVLDAIVVEHEFNDVFGGFYDEAHWSVAAETVTMHVVGNGKPYVHPLPAWQVGWVGPGGESIQAEVLKVLDKTTRVVRLEAVKLSGTTHGPMNWGEVEADPQRSGPVQFSSAVRNAVADNARFTNVTFDVHKIHKLGPFLYTDFLFAGESVCLTVPVNAVGEVAYIVGNRARTPELLSEVTYLMKNRYARARIPPGLKAQTMTAIVALGFVVNLKNEIDIQYTMLERFTWAMSVHSILLQFGKVTVKSWPWLLASAIVFVVGYSLPLEIEANAEWQRVLIAFAMIPALLCCVCCMRVTVGVHRDWRRYLLRNWQTELASADSPSAPLLGHGFTIERNLPIAGSRYIRPDHPALQGDLEVGATRERTFEPERMLVSGIVADGAMPLALATTQEAERSAVTNRVLAPRTNPDDASLVCLEGVFGALSEFAIRGKIDTSKAAADRWFNKLAGTYPAEYITNLKDTWSRYQGVMPQTVVATKGFLKVEKAAATVGVGGGKAVKPRLIQPPEDVDKAMTGPLVYQLYELIRDYWNGIKTPVLYCSGRSLAYVGRCVDAFISKHDGQVWGWSADMATYDATLCYPIQEKAFNWYTKIGLPAWAIGWLTRVRSRGVTPNGVYYEPKRLWWFEDENEAITAAAKWRKLMFKVKGPVPGFHPTDEDKLDGFVIEVEDFQMTSGRMDTNLTDTVALVASILASGLLDKEDYLLLVCGDDAFLLLSSRAQEIVDGIMAFQRTLGLKPEGKVSADRSDWEFCSKLFWFAQDKGKTITVLGSKPFRGIARMGVNTTLPGAANAAAAALSVRVDSGHVPFLGPFADRTYELCALKHIRPRGKAEWTAMRGDRRYDPSPLNYTITQARYGLGEENEREFKRKLAELSSVPIVCEYAPLMDAVRRDEE
jgi:hypothetical protein